jgi:hypothetical protein
VAEKGVCQSWGLLRGARLRIVVSEERTYEEAANSLVWRKALGELDDTVRGHGRVLGVAALLDPDDGVAFLEVVRVVGGDGGDGAGALLAEDEWVAGRGRVEAGAELDGRVSVGALGL